MRTIALRGKRGGVALVDYEDYDALSTYRWTLGTDGYARRHGLKSEGMYRRGIAMHRQILGLRTGSPGECDHINGDRLDNRRQNLRIVTRAQNNQNVRHKTGLSGHRNVYFHPASGLWRVQLRSSGRLLSGGYFRAREDAIERAREMRRVHLPFAEES